MARAFIGVGANLEPEANIRAALRLLSAHARVLAISTFYRTPAEGRPEQPDYYNGVVSVATDLPPESLKREVLRAIEQALGRKRTADPNAPRPIDLDLLLYDALQLRRGKLRLPSQDIERRAFVAVPLAEIAPDVLLPGSGAPIRAIAARFSGAPMAPLASLSDDLRRACL